MRSSWKLFLLSPLFSTTHFSFSKTKVKRNDCNASAQWYNFTNFIHFHKKNSKRFSVHDLEILLYKKVWLKHKYYKFTNVEFCSWFKPKLSQYWINVLHHCARLLHHMLHQLILHAFQPSFPLKTFFETSFTNAHSCGFSNVWLSQTEIFSSTEIENIPL